MTTLSPIPPFPALSDRAAGTYNSKAYAFGNHMGAVFQPEMAALMPELQSAATAAATASAAAIAAANYKGEWSTLSGALAIPASVFHSSKVWMLTESVADVTAQVPGVSAKWISLTASAPSLTRSARTSNTIIGTADKGALIDITSGTFSQTFDAVATLGDGWWCYLRNSGTGDITLDPSGAELIDGLSTFVMYPGEVRLLQCDGLTLRSVVMQPFYKTFTASGTFVKPPGYTVFDSLTWSGGNSGRKTDVFGGALGGGGGGCFPAKIPATALSASTAITVGAGGAARTTTADGALGGDSSIGTLVVVKQAAAYTHGGAVMVGLSAVMGAAAGGGQVGDFGYITGSSASAGALWGGGASAGGQPSAGSIYGGGAGGSYYGGGLYTAGASSFGGSGGAAGDAVSGTDGTAPGGGGGGTNTGAQSGAGARGEVRIWGAM